MNTSAYHWSLDELLAPWAGSDVPSIAVSGINLDSRLVVAGDVYLAVGGATTHGLRFAMSAIDAGAVAIVVSTMVDAQFDALFNAIGERGIPVVVLDQLETRCGLIASRFFGEPDKAMTILAVTGTDGKTSVCRFIANAFSAIDRTCGYIGTVGWGLGDELNDTALTTPDSVTLRRMLAIMRDQGAAYVALEASSHGIAEGRLDGLELDVAVLTNLGRDHLDYHITLEAYRAAKESLFRWDSLRAVVLNTDDQMGRDLLAQIDHIPRYSYSANGVHIESGAHHVSAANVVAHDTGVSFDLVTQAGTQAVNSELLGRFNVDNLLACYASLAACDIAANDASHALGSVKSVSGRMERLGGGDKPTVVIDYSHTPGALQVAIDAVRVHCANELWVVFGCGGDRDTGKRAPMARAARSADCVVVTDDNPRTEDSASIINEVMKGFDDLSRVTVIADRALAIRHALTHTKKGDLVLIAGKGHEDYQIIGTVRQPFSDREQAWQALESAS